MINLDCTKLISCVIGIYLKIHIKCYHYYYHYHDIRNLFSGWTTVHFWNLKWDRYMFEASNLLKARKRVLEQSSAGIENTRGLFFALLELKVRKVHVWYLSKAKKRVLVLAGTENKPINSHSLRLALLSPFPSSAF